MKINVPLIVVIINSNISKETNSGIQHQNSAHSITSPTECDGVQSGVQCVRNLIKSRYVRALLGIKRKLVHENETVFNTLIAPVILALIGPGDGVALFGDRVLTKPMLTNK